MSSLAICQDILWGKRWGLNIKWLCLDDDDDDDYYYYYYYYYWKLLEQLQRENQHLHSNIAKLLFMIGTEKVLTLTGWLWQLFDVYESSLSSNIWNKEEYKEAMALLRYFFSCLQWHPSLESYAFHRLHRWCTYYYYASHLMDVALIIFATLYLLHMIRNFIFQGLFKRWTSSSSWKMYWNPTMCFDWTWIQTVCTSVLAPRITT